MFNYFYSIPKRIFNVAVALCCAAMMAYAYYSQYVDGLEPCPLCMFQRVALLLVGVMFALAALHNPAQLGSRVYAGLIGLSSLLGASIAGRHVWLQNLPEDLVPECGPGLDYMLDVLPLSETLSIVLNASGECADINWQFLGLSMPAWVLTCFIGLGVLGVWRNLSD